MSCRLTFSVDCHCNGMNKNNKHGTSASLGGVLLSLSSLVAFVASSVDGGDVELQIPLRFATLLNGVFLLTQAL